MTFSFDPSLPLGSFGLSLYRFTVARSCRSQAYTKEIDQDCIARDELGPSIARLEDGDTLRSRELHDGELATPLDHSLKSYLAFKVHLQHPGVWLSIIGEALDRQLACCNHKYIS